MTPLPPCEPLDAARLLFDLPSVNEVLTIRQCGFPRTYNLNDGMGPDAVSHRDQAKP
jgi:hypothetical protein